MPPIPPRPKEPPPSPPFGASQLSKDLSLLLSSPAAALPFLRGTKPHTSKSALEVLQSYTPGQATADQTQELARGYIRMVKDEIEPMQKHARLEGLGDRIDAVRGKGEAVSGALGEVKV